MIIDQCKNNSEFVYTLLSNFLFKELREVNGMAVLIITQLIIQNTINTELLHKFLLKCNSFQLVEIVTSFKNKLFGKGLGSKYQKIIRKVMETWDFDRLEKELVFHNRYLYRLLRLIHPRFHGKKGQLLRSAFQIEIIN